MCCYIFTGSWDWDVDIFGGGMILPTMQTNNRILKGSLFKTGESVKEETGTSTLVTNMFNQSTMPSNYLNNGI